MTPQSNVDGQETYIWHPFEKFKPYFEQGQTYVTFSDTKNDIAEETLVEEGTRLALQSYKFSTLDEDRFLFNNGPSEKPPYDPALDIASSRLFQSNMPAVHPRDIIINSEGFWGKFIFLREDGELVRYWKSRAARDRSYREEVREMVAILGSLIFEMIIWVSQNIRASYLRQYISLTSVKLTGGGSQLTIGAQRGG